jgi:mRNA interferase MazF
MSKTKDRVFPVRGEVWIVGFNPSIGHEQGGVRPALIVSEDTFNRSPAELVMVAPITGTDRGVPAHVRVDPPEGGLAKVSFIMTDQIRSISKLRLGRRIGSISSNTMSEVEDRLHYLLGI